MPAPRLLFSVKFWIALCLMVRVIALLAMPAQGEAFLNRAMDSAKPFPSGAIAFLERRTDFRPLTEDEHCYDEMGQNICRGRGFVVDTLWVITTPGQPAMYGGCAYPLFLAGIYTVFGTGNELFVFIAQILLQGLALYFIFETAQRIAGPIAALISGAFFTFHPVLIWLSVAVMTEAILVPAMAGLIWLVCCKSPSVKWALSVGSILAVMALTRSTASALVWLTIAWLLFHHRRASLRPAIVLIVTFLFLCAPWTIRNYVHWHRFIPFSTKSGVNAWFFNHPGLKVEFSRAAVEGPQPVDIFDPRIQSLPDEAARNDRLMAMFKEFFHAHPLKFIGLCWMRFWMAILPARITSTTSGALFSAWYAKGIPLVICSVALFLAGARKKIPQRPGVVFPLLIAAYWQAIQSLAGPGLRYRLPVEPAWAIILGVAVVCIGDMLRARRETLARP